jgi:protoporphyrinogen oxidase
MSISWYIPKIKSVIPIPWPCSEDGKCISTFDMADCLLVSARAAKNDGNFVILDKKGNILKHISDSKKIGSHEIHKLLIEVQQIANKKDKPTTKTSIKDLAAQLKNEMGTVFKSTPQPILQSSSKPIQHQRRHRHFPQQQQQMQQPMHLQPQQQQQMQQPMPPLMHLQPQHMHLQSQQQYQISSPQHFIRQQHHMPTSGFGQGLIVWM